jgi:hypothetical protein
MKELLDKMGQFRQLLGLKEAELGSLFEEMPGVYRVVKAGDWLLRNMGKGLTCLKVELTTHNSKLNISGQLCPARSRNRDGRSLIYNYFETLIKHYFGNV